MSTYAAQMLRAQLTRGPYPGEDFYRLHVSGNGSTPHVNVTAAELARIAEVLEVESCRQCAGLLTRVKIDPDHAETITFVAWLRSTLIPDLRESGSNATADDFDRCCDAIDDLIVGQSQTPSRERN